ncbi:Protein of uncharacterised function (DUF2580) [Mycolicibacterium aurum]|uniref:Protein of uncharacterized function (DUF2580) n=1 Tax=Mycolicibacterium aurum TaxID=1791 RepID=A0A448II84_MYCAU|nr:type VII secretion target [Mycolicibacterium aurum]VEG52191.1 Protein of uncharacterised function (DUF2580) [Mycolicibacterium aurum]
MSVRLSVDTGLLRDYGAACAAHASDLDAAVDRLTALGPAPLFGPVGARFVASLIRAAETEAGTLARLRSSVAAGTTAALGSAAEYDGTDDRAASRITGIR